MLTTEIQLRKLVRSLWRMGGRAFFQTKLPQWICRRGAVGLPISFTSRTPGRPFQRTYFWGPQVPSLQDIANLQFHHKQPARPKKNHGRVRLGSSAVECFPMRSSEEPCGYTPQNWLGIPSDICYSHVTCTYCMVKNPKKVGEHPDGYFWNKISFQKRITRTTPRLFFCFKNRFHRGTSVSTARP